MFWSSQWIYAVAFDVLLLISLFALGGGFWDKLRSLFRHDTYAVLPDKNRRGNSKQLTPQDGRPKNVAGPKSSR